MERIEVGGFWGLLFPIMTVVGCVGWHLLLIVFTTIVVLGYGKVPFSFCAMMILFIGVGLAALPTWYRTFFDRSSAGMDQALSIEWSTERVVFRGSSFEIDVPVKDLVKYRLVGAIKKERMCCLDVMFKKPNGKIDVVHVPSVMLDKGKFMDFLDTQGVKRCRY